MSHGVGGRASGWRALLAFAPLLGVGFVVLALAQGGTDVATTRAVYLILAPVSALGAWAAWSLARVAGMPVVPIGSAQPGFVALRGRAKALPGSALVTPDRLPCVWFTYSTIPKQTISSRPYRSYAAIDSVAPFLLVDDSGECIVIPGGASIDGGHRSDDASSRERYIAEGDRLFVAGAFEAPSLDAVQRVRDAFDAQAREPVAVIVRGVAEEDVDRVRAERTDTPPRPVMVTVPALPVMAAPKGIGAFVITAKDGETAGSFYGLLKAVDLVVLLACCGMAAWLTLRVVA